MLLISDKAVCGVFVRMYVCMHVVRPSIRVYYYYWPGSSDQARYSVAFPFLRWGIFLPMGTEIFF